MIPRGTFRCRLCNERYHKGKMRKEYRSYIPERMITLCEYCYDEWRTAPEYSHLRPDIDPNDIEDIRRMREYYGEDHVFY